MSETFRVALLMGSDSDYDVLKPAVEVLDRLGVPCDVEVISAHRTPDRLDAFLRDAPQRGVRVFIAGAGSAAHLAGAIAARTTLPVLGVPVDVAPLNGFDSLLSTVQMPAGVPVGTLGVGRSGAANAGWLAAAVLALADAELAERLAAARREQADKVSERSRRLQERLRQERSGGAGA